jgi:hypothetical protein
LRNPRQIKADKRAWMISASNTVPTGTATLTINVVMSMIVRNPLRTARFAPRVAKKDPPRLATTAGFLRTRRR